MRDALALSYTPLALHLANQASQRSPASIHRDELMSDAMEGVLYALEHFNLDSDFQLNSYVYISVEHAILKSESLRPGAVRYPRKPALGTPIEVEIDAEMPAPAQADVCLKMDMEKGMQTLAPAEQYILKMYYGFEDTPVSHQKIGERLNLSHTMIRRKKIAALQKLRQWFRK